MSNIGVQVSKNPQARRSTVGRRRLEALRSRGPKALRSCRRRPPRGYPQHAWQQLIIDAGRFLELWGGQAAALGWQDWELFGVHRRAPWHRLDARGLVLALQGRELAALTAGAAVLRTRTGAHQTYRRKVRDPLHPAERCMVWELG